MSPPSLLQDWSTRLAGGQEGPTWYIIHGFVCTCTVLRQCVLWGVMLCVLSRVCPAVNQTKEVTHIWELGGGTFLAPLVDLPITCDTIE